jgi:hypothetical protein
MSDINSLSQEKKSSHWLPILTSGLFLGICLGMTIFTGLIKGEKVTTNLPYYLAVNAYYAGCLQNQSVGRKEIVNKKYCQDATDYYATSIRLIDAEIK